MHVPIAMHKDCYTVHFRDDLKAPVPMVHCTSHYDHGAWDHDIDDELHKHGSTGGEHGPWE